MPCPYNRKNGKDKENIRNGIKQLGSEENIDHDENCQCRFDMSSNSSEKKEISADKKTRTNNENYTLQVK